MAQPVRVGLLGCGVVGTATARILSSHAAELETRTGAPIRVARIAVRDASIDRGLDVDRSVWTTDPSEVVNDPSIDIVVEVMGGVEPARTLILEAIANKKHVVTANKELLSTYGSEVMGAAESNGVDLLFEASVAGGIPIIRPIRESLAGDRVTRVMGIVNGTTNFILTRMSEMGVSFEEALAQAIDLGYAEADPTADIDGHDAAAKIAILASLAFDSRVVSSDVPTEGIRNITRADIAAAHQLGYEVKLLAIGELVDGTISARVHPAMIPKTHPLASVRDVFNAVFVQGEQSGDLMFLGRGAGGSPTAAAVVGDVVEIARNASQGARTPAYVGFHEDASIRAQEDVAVRYYIVLSVADQPGVLSEVAGVFAHHGVSIASVRQEGFGSEATLMLITHIATEGQHRATLEDLRGHAGVKAIESTIRVEGTPEG
ncbi:MAG: homoserine dehydrogenase [Actinomycetota bacterium]|jgi:homoserine dehydrogenase|nr:homoserine dehydrogenase [Actinomycetota bacterium]